MVLSFGYALEGVAAAAFEALASLSPELANPGWLLIWALLFLICLVVVLNQAM